MEYHYHSLDTSQKEIRLLSLQPGSAIDVLQGSLRHVSLNDPDHYESVSYCWGNIELRSSIEIDGALLDISRNAAEVLIRLRHEHAPRTLWIDVACINQKDVAERGQQVADMHHIYNRAARNLVWLGPHDGTVKPVLDVMKVILDEAKLETDNFRTFFEDVYDNEGNVQPSLSGFMSRFDAEPLLKLFCRPWFQRLWVVQENVLAPMNIGYCGSHEFVMLDLLRAAAFLYSKRNHLVYDIRSNTGLYNAATVGELSDPGNEPERRISRDAEKMKLSSLLRKLQRFRTLDPRDHVYGILGLYRHYLPRGQLPMLLEPDYNKAVVEVLRDATKFAILDQGSLDPLNKVSHWPEEEDGFPTWVPHWHRKWSAEHDTSGLVTYSDASGGSNAQIAYSRFGTANILSLKGFLPAGSEVIEVSQSYGSTNEAAAFIAEARSIASRHEETQACYGDLTTAFATTVLGNRSLESRPVSKQDLSGLEIFEGYVDETKSIPPPIRTLNAFSQNCEPFTWRASRFLGAFWRACRLRRFFVTASGHIGIGPQTMQSGDVVAILYGGYTPFVLRREGSQYQLVGECYVHGVMNGEAVEQHIDQGGADVVFHIK